MNNTETEFLNEEFTDISIESLSIDTYVLPYIQTRISEVKTYLSAKAALSVIFLTGSILEGGGLGLAHNNPAMYNQAKHATKDSKARKTRSFHEWTLSDLIDISCEVSFLRDNV